MLPGRDLNTGSKATGHFFAHEAPRQLHREENAPVKRIEECFFTACKNKTIVPFPLGFTNVSV